MRVKLGARTASLVQIGGWPSPENADRKKPIKKAKALFDALAAMKLEEKVVTNFYGDITEQIRSADPKDATGFAKKADSAKRFETFQKSLQEFGAKRDHEGALALVDKTLKEGGFELEASVQLMMTRSAILASSGKFDEALKSVDEAASLASDSPMSPMIDQFRKRLEEGKEEAAKKATEASGEKKSN